MDLKEALVAIQEVIDTVPDEDYVECLEEVISLAQSSLDARLEEMKHEDE